MQRVTFLKREAKATIIVFAFFFILNTSYCQNYFNNLYYDGTYPELTLLTSILVEDNGYFTIGHQPTYVDRQILLLKLNTQGDTIWRKNYSDEPKLFYPRKVIPSNSDYFIAGSIKDSVDTNDSDFFLSKFDSAGNFQWMFRYGGNLFEECNDLIRLSDGNFILVGQSRSFGGGDKDFYLVKVDTLGNLIWQQTYGGGGADIAHRVLETPDKGFILSGGSNSFNSDYDVYIVKTDSLGNFQWQKTYDTGFDDNSGIITAFVDGNYLISSAYPSGDPNCKGRLIKIAPSGEIIWQQDYTYSGGRMSLNLLPIENIDGTIIVGGYVAPVGLYARGYILKTDPMGNKILEREYYTRIDAPQYFFDIQPTNDSGYVACGFAYPDTSIWQKSWIVKLDCFGCDSNLCYFADSACFVYDCTLYPIDAFFTSSVDTVDLAFGNTVTFTNSSLNTSARTWNFGDDSTGYTSAIKTHTYSQTGTYTVSLIVYHGKCTDTFTREIVVINTVGIHENDWQKAELKIYPNPSSGEMTVEYELFGNSPAELLLCDITGKQILSFPINTGKGKMMVNLQELEAGTYLYSLMKDGKIITSTLHLIMK